MRRSCERTALRLVRGLAVAIAAIATVAVIRALTSPGGRRALARLTDRVGRKLRFWSGRLRGVAYRLRGRHPDPDVADGVLTQRIRSTLGPLEKRLDVPRVHVEVVDHIALLHGEVPTHDDAAEIEHAVAAVSGVRGTESHLHVGPIPDDQRARSADGRPPAASDARKRLIAAAIEAGAPPDAGPPVVRAVLGFLAERVPGDELDQFLGHLPHDVRVMCEKPHHAGAGARAKAVRTVPQLIATIAPVTAPLTADETMHVVEAVFGTLRELVPEEDHDVAAVLPADLRAFWLHAVSPAEET